jgi:hypothetical protein
MAIKKGIRIVLKSRAPNANQINSFAINAPSIPTDIQYEVRKKYNSNKIFMNRNCSGISLMNFNIVKNTKGSDNKTDGA